MRITHAEIDVRKLKRNYQNTIGVLPSNVKVMGIVKANAYGHGVLEISRLLTDFGIDYLGVGFLEEGIYLRENGLTVPILVLGGVLDNQIRSFLDNNLDITVSSLEIAERIEHEVIKDKNFKARIHLKIDTGMERIGVHLENALPFIERVCRMKHLDIVGIYSHFASADERDKAYTHYQLDRFQSLLKKINAMGIDIPLKHIANSGAIIDMPETYLTMVRPGIMLYGIYPSLETTERIPIEPVLSLKSKVVFIKEVPANTSISYGRKYFTSKRTKIATIPVGYGDGYSRRLTNNSEVLIAGKRYPVVGVICMDQMMVDIGYDANIHVGEDVLLIGDSAGERISAWELAERVGTNPYELLTGIATRVPRVFINENGGD
ncbi:MAG: alanine racemase [Ignavibacteriales bacterium]|nr:alanine racemase [Ignavibacteriales bacterium]